MLDCVTRDEYYITAEQTVSVKTEQLEERETQRHTEREREKIKSITDQGRP